MIGGLKAVERQERGKKWRERRRTNNQDEWQEVE